MKRALALDALAVALAWISTSAPLPRDWIENQYANGLFAAMNRAFVPLANRVPFAIGDLEAIVAIVALTVWWTRSLRGTPRKERRRMLLALLAHTAGWAAVGVVAFETLWGLNYRRDTI